MRLTWFAHQAPELGMKLARRVRRRIPITVVLGIELRIKSTTTPNAHHVCSASSQQLPNLLPEA